MKWLDYSYFSGFIVSSAIFALGKKYLGQSRLELLSDCIAGGRVKKIQGKLLKCRRVSWMGIKDGNETLIFKKNH